MEKMNSKAHLIPVFLMIFLSLTTVLSLPAAEIIRINSTNRHLLPKGKEVDGAIGDWIMKNDKVIAVIADAYPDREANQMVSSIQGGVIDFTSLKANNDQLVIYYPQGARVDFPAADTIIVLQGKGSAVSLKVLKKASAREPYIAMTTYTLRDGNAYLEVNTEYQNTSDAPVSLKFADKVRCDNDLTDVSPAGVGQLAYIYNKWYKSAYGVATPSGSLFTKAMGEKPKLTDVGIDTWVPYKGQSTGEPVQLAAGEKISVSRVLLTGDDIADLQQQFASITGNPSPAWKIQVFDTKNNAIAGAFVFAKSPKDELVSAAMTQSDGSALLFPGKGEFKLGISKPGHDTIFQNVTIADQDGGSVAIMQPQTLVSIHITGPDGKYMPVKIEFRGTKGTKDPFLGPFKRAEGAGNNWFNTTTSFDVPVPPGTYEIAFSRGPEFDVILKTVTVQRGNREKIDVMMKRAYSTPNWIVADMHNHTTGSGDTNAEIEGRMYNLAGSGIEFAPATEHNRISTFTEHIEQLGLQKFIASAAGVELSGRPGPGDINHQNGWPVKIQEDKRGNGAPKTDKDPYMQMKRLYDYDGGKFKLMQQNHPNIGWLYFDKDRDGVADDGFGTASITHCLEINGTLVEFPRILAGERSRSRLLPWLQMLNLGYRIYGTANSDSHVVSHATGSVFSYIYTANDNPEKIDEVELAHQVKNGHVVISNGPFMDIRMNGSLPGEEIKVKDGKVTVKVKVMTSNWCPVNTVQVVVNGRADQSLVFTNEKNPELFKEGVTAFEHEIPVSLKTDAHLIVLAYGKGETVGKVQGSKMRNAIPIVMSNPVFVDVDGNGFIANKDLLDNPIPTGKSFGRAPTSEED